MFKNRGVGSNLTSTMYKLLDSGHIFLTFISLVFKSKKKNVDTPVITTTTNSYVRVLREAMQASMGPE